VSNQSPNANSKDQQPQDPMSKNEAEPDEQKPDKGHPPLKGTDTPAHTSLEYADR
jgi:hypothetical protein